MLSTLFIASAILATVLFVLMIFFDVWVYLNTKDLAFVLSVWVKRHKEIDQRLMPKQAILLKAICATELGIKYFFYFVFIPIAALYIFSLFMV